MRHKNLITRKQIKHFGCKCYELSLNKIASQEELKKYVIEKYNPDIIGQLERKLKGKLIIDRNTTKPHLIFIRKSTYAEITKNTQIISEVQDEMRLIIFCWDTVPELASEEFMKSEIRKMNEAIKLQLKEFTQKEKLKSKSKIL